MKGRNRKLSKFLLISFGMTYLCWGALAVLIRTGVLYFSHPAAVCLHLLGGFGPTVAAVSVFDAPICAASVRRFVFGRKQNRAQYAWTFGILELLVVGLSSGERNPELPLQLVPLVFLQAVFLYGGNEELGWRGTMQPLLEDIFPFPAASLITGTVWGIWHVPLWFVDGASQQNIPFFLFLLLGILLSFFFAAVYRKTGSVFFCCLLHGLTNTLLSLFVIRVNLLLIAGLGCMLLYALYLGKTGEA